MVDVRLDLRTVIHQLGEVERSERLAREAASLSERLGDDDRIGKASQALTESTGDTAPGHQARAQRGRLYHDQGDYRQAAAALRDSLDALEAAGEMSSSLMGAVPFVASSTAYLGWSLAEPGEFEEATRRTQAALRVVETLGNPMGVMMACMGVGMVHVRQGNAAAAIAPLKHGLRICHQFGLTALIFHGIAASLGAAYALVNREAEGVTLLRKVADQSWSMKLVSDHLIGAIPLAGVWLSMGRLDEADQLARQSSNGRARTGSAGTRPMRCVCSARSPLAAIGPTCPPPRPTTSLRSSSPARSACDRWSPTAIAASARCTGGPATSDGAKEHVTTATTMYRDMGMPFWLEKADGPMD
jgi:hypothetical protein